MNKNSTQQVKIDKPTRAFLSRLNRLSFASLLIATTAASADGAETVLEASHKQEQDQPIQFPALSVVGHLNSSVGAGSSVLKLKDIERTQANNLAELVDQLPGVSSSGSPRPGGQTLNIWGMGDMEDVKVTLDDAPKGFEKYRQGSVFIEPELIKRIDVDKGPHNIMDGNGGFGGTVKITTKDPEDLLRTGQHFGAMFKYSYHTNDRQNIYSSALYGKTLNGIADGLLYVSKRKGDDLRRPDGSRFGFSQSDQLSYLIKSNIYLNDQHTLSLSAMRSESDNLVPWAAKRDELSTPTQREIDQYGFDGAIKRKLVQRDQQDQNYSVKWNFIPENSDLINLTATYAWSKTKQHDTRPENASKFLTSSLGNKSWVNYTDQLFDIHNESVFDTGRLEHQVTIGARWHKNDRGILMFDAGKANKPEYNYGYFQPQFMPAGVQETTSAYIQDAITWNRLTITPGVRYDYVTNKGKGNLAATYMEQDPLIGHDYRSVTYSGISPHLGLLWKTTPNLTLFGDISRTWRAPVIDEQYEVQFANSSLTGSSRNLGKERMHGIRLGAIVDFDQVIQADDQLQIRTTLFRNRGKDEIFRRRGEYCEAKKYGIGDCERPLSNYRNLPGYTIEGLEIELFYDSPNLFGKMAYSTIKGERDASPRDPWFGQKTWIGEIPPDTLHVMLGYKLPQWHTHFGVTGDFVGHQVRSPADRDPKADSWGYPKSKGYALYGAFAQWNPEFISDTEIRVTATNLFDQDYYPYLGESVSGVGRDVRLSITKYF
ncbi:TonB-dependent hemoglobin/transferrin/lactoferrin family receptor [Providencia stuartii]|uniref:TonB-dependent hemoglobin/transferrin/lactoferrin family receptor n=1 Tax=Providencia stuartii TaxID=588 RepID=A0ABD5L972_PROST|nr:MULTISPECIES: TonB-dependent hemoglobin/transferrin/lactoferrin family receptor [Providencia]ELR5043545.1 TonB-dependent hemoglobin/transferrin/lactoferrin family receptor [Providencia rettgeri]ELR5046587.1 TonB-dependent hemoglobin/transferrin/lactoferrin family receptor [Providencia rettgeri]ELR5142906.1 TonB-dependent hemoglobin/transferrin/lactoferrin family receptor [Providencia stuartii]ELR5144775.1 TonB-dependent hemoglobin/transferrin/lactoferrin family receptor [Providencia stuartii